MNVTRVDIGNKWVLDIMKDHLTDGIVKVNTLRNTKEQV